MAYTLGNKCAKNLCKQIVLLQLFIENVVTCFLEHSVPIHLRRTIWSQFMNVTNQRLTDVTTCSTAKCTSQYIEGLQHKRTMSTKPVFEKIAKVQRSYVLLCDYYWQNRDILQWCKQNKHFYQITGNKYSCRPRN